ncbi:phage terminase, large subunit, PBSX family [Oribacterium sp. oral taxon 078 str. F0263]|uniref:PBSX family phage terminase large subunit n=1 Tax=Oribacterium sp. oral taxon 078 TaxID=652706 RepID=UPI0003ADD635|nr:PBSX family phage terminase large subunit [Oribacterium sp. oral taxon 078]ERL19804.1 phage terminase, large subunit, PBSX family [Oribacterium sp. oral taxon 078 str. F0263]
MTPSSEIRISDLIIPKFWGVFNDEEHTHKILTSGRAGTKSSEAAIETVFKIVQGVNGCAVVIRKRHNKLRKTVYKEIKRAIKRLSLDERLFKITVSPMEVTFLENGNTIYFTGSDNTDDTKGIIDESKPIRLVMIDEVNEFFEQGEGEDELQNIEATFVRGNDEGFQMLYLYNPPKNPNAPVVQWTRKMEQRPDTIHVHVDYRDVPEAWIGKKLLESAEILRQIDERQWRWLWLGLSIGVDELIYYMFGGKNVARTKEDAFPLIGVGVDYGQQNATTYQAAGLNMAKHRLEGLAEYYHSGRESGTQKSPSRYAEDFVAFLDGLHEAYRCSSFYVFIDPSAAGLAEEIKRAIHGCGYSVRLRDAQNDVALGISRVQKLLTFGMLTVSPEQENARREFGLYEYDRKSIERGREKPVKAEDHCMDAIRYLVMGLWPKLKYYLPAQGKEEENEEAEGTI